jgi:hypothetical protein
LILPPALYWVCSRDRKAHLYVVFSIPFLPHPIKAQIFSSAPNSQTSSLYLPPSMWATKFHAHTIIVLFILIFTFLESKLEHRIFWTQW